VTERAVVFDGRRVSVFDVMNHEQMNSTANEQMESGFSAKEDISF
jgi:hypothetical protein